MNLYIWYDIIWFNYYDIIRYDIYIYIERERQRHLYTHYAMFICVYMYICAYTKYTNYLPYVYICLYKQNVWTWRMWYLPATGSFTGYHWGFISLKLWSWLRLWVPWPSRRSSFGWVKHFSTEGPHRTFVGLEELRNWSIAERMHL